jgi:HD-like signal output (HDOD) protein
MKKNQAHVAPAAPSELTGQSIEKMLSTIRIPPRPSLLFEVQHELGSKDPSPKRLSAIIGQDVAMAGALLKLANSAFVGLKLKAKSVEQAVMRLGMEQCSLLLTGILARDAIKIEGVSLTQFWDNSTKRAQAMGYYAKRLTLCRSDIAHTFGLFSNIGVPLLMIKYPNYNAVVDAALRTGLCPIATIEDQHFQTNHAALGALLARTWGLPAEVIDAILLHHFYDVLADSNTGNVVRNLVALALLVDYGIAHSHSGKVMPEWEIGGVAVCQYLGISQSEADDIADEIQQMFDEV